VFGYYAWRNEWQGVTVDLAGSGIFVAPGIGLSAKHVSKSFEKLDDGVEAIQRRSSILADQYAIQPAVTQYSSLVYQASTVRMPSEADSLFWRVMVDWYSPDTDITVLQMEPVSPASRRAAQDGMAFMEWQLLPPGCGSEVDVFGFPHVKIRVDPDVHVQDIRLISHTVRVVETFDVLQTHGFTSFPGFQVDRDLEHGFSGGPVFYHGRLIGIFSGPNYVSSLWPLVIHEYPPREDNLDIDVTNAGSIRKPLRMRRLSELFESGIIQAIDFGEVRPRVRRVPCEEALGNSRIQSRCNAKHVILNG